MHRIGYRFSVCASFRVLFSVFVLVHINKIFYFCNRMNWKYITINVMITIINVSMIINLVQVQKRT